MEMGARWGVLYDLGATILEALDIIQNYVVYLVWYEVVQGLPSCLSDEMFFKSLFRLVPNLQGILSYKLSICAVLC